jgi:hypothetical protein
MAHVMKNGESDKFDEFVRICEKAFNIVRLHGHLLITHFIGMLAAGLPELESESDIHYLRDKLALEVLLTALAVMVPPEQQHRTREAVKQL